MSAFKSRSHPRCMFGRLRASYSPAYSPLASFRDHPRVSLSSCIQKPCLGLKYSKVRFEMFKSTIWLKHLRFTLSSGLGKKSLPILCRTQKIFSGLKASAIALSLQISLCHSQAWDFQKSVIVPLKFNLRQKSLLCLQPCQTCSIQPPLSVWKYS